MTRRRDIAAEDDTGMKALLDAGTPVVTIVGKTWDLHVREVLRRLARREPADDRRLGRAICAAQGREVIYDAEHFFDGFKRNPEYAAADAPGRRRRRRGVVVLCDTNGGTLPEEVAEAVAQVVARASTSPVGIHTP